MTSNDPERPDGEQAAIMAAAGAVIGVLGWVANKLAKGQGSWK